MTEMTLEVQILDCVHLSYTTSLRVAIVNGELKMCSNLNLFVHHVCSTLDTTKHRHESIHTSAGISPPTEGKTSPALLLNELC